MEQDEALNKQSIEEFKEQQKKQKAQPADKKPEKKKSGEEKSK